MGTTRWAHTSGVILLNEDFDGSFEMELAGTAIARTNDEKARTRGMERKEAD